MTSKNKNGSLNAEAQKISNINSHWHLSYLRLKKNRYGMFGLYGVLFIFFIAIFAEFLSPHSYKKTVQDELYNPPQLIRFIDSEGNFHLRPFVLLDFQFLNKRNFAMTL